MEHRNIFHPYKPIHFTRLCNCRASEASETPSIATYRKKCLGVSMSKPQCACSQFYVKRRSGRACTTRRLLAVREFNYEELALRTSKRQSACTSNNFTCARPFNGNHFLVNIYTVYIRTDPITLPCSLACAGNKTRE